MEKTYQNLKKTKDKDGEVSFDAELTAQIVAEKEREVLARAGADLSMPGFRKGRAPGAMVRERIGQVELLEDAVHEALPDAVREIMEDEKVASIGRPEVAVTKLAPGNPVMFTVRFALMPEVGLPNYKSIAQKIMKGAKPVIVAREEVDDAVRRLREMLRTGAAGKDEGASLPELTDDLAKQFGPYKNVAEFYGALTRNLAEGKERDEKEKRRETIVREIAAKTKVKIPALLIDQEFVSFLENRDAELKKAGIPLEEYMKQIKKTEQELEQEERKAIEQQIVASLVMGAMRKEEKITADEKDVVANVLALKRRYPDRTDAELWEPAEAIATQKKLFDVLEGVKEKG